MSSFDRIVEMINENNTLDFPLTRDNVSFDKLMSDPEAKWNTRVTVDAKPNSDFVGSVNVYYTRSNLTDLGPSLEIMQEDPLTLQSLCDIINQTKNCQITPEDLTISELPPMETGTVLTLVLNASPYSLVWLNNIQVSLLTGIPREAKNLATFLNVTLPSLFA